MDEGEVGRGSTHHFALLVEIAEELEGWRHYLQSRGVGCTEVLDRQFFKSIYLRDPDGHIVELATRAPGFPSWTGRTAWRRGVPPGRAPPDRIRPGESSFSRIAGLARLRREHGGERLALARGERADLLVLGQAEREQQPPAAGAAPAPLAHQQVADLHARRLPRAVEHDLGRRQPLRGHPALQLGSRQANAVGVVERPAGAVAQQSVVAVSPMFRPPRTKRCL